MTNQPKYPGTVFTLSECQWQLFFRPSVRYYSPVMTAKLHGGDCGIDMYNSLTGGHKGYYDGNHRVLIEGNGEGCTEG